MGHQIGDFHLRLSHEESETLRQMAASNQVPVTSVVRACVRHFILEWRAGKDVTMQLGAVVFDHGMSILPREQFNEH